MDAQIVFRGSSQLGVVSRTTMLMAYAQQGQPEKALQLYVEMSEEGVALDKLTIMRVIQACGMLAGKEETVMVDGRATKVKALGKGRAVHAYARNRGYKADGFLGHTLISMYGKCESILDAQHVFDELSRRDVVSWTGLIAAYASSQQGLPEKAIQLYEQMQEQGVSPNDRTFVSVLQACATLAAKDDVAMGNRPCTGEVPTKLMQRVKAIHAIACIRGYMSDVYVSSSLMSMYGKIGRVEDAVSVFERTPHRNLVSWNTMAAVYIQNGQAADSLQLYVRMQEEGVTPDSWTFVSALQACGNLSKIENDMPDGQLKPLEQGKAIHLDAQRKGCNRQLFVGNSLICMYAKCGSIEDARKVFDGMSKHKRDVVSWNTMLSAYVEQGQEEAALQLFREMSAEKGLEPDEITLTSALQACSRRGSLEVCRQIHGLAAAPTRSHWSSCLANTLIHAYARCASMPDAQSVFDTLPQPDVVAWTTLIAGYARQGDSTASLRCFHQMQLAGVKPNGATFLAVLCACSHAGLVDRGVEYLESMTRDHGIDPEMEHFVSMVDLLGRAGRFDAVETLMATMRKQPSLAFWLCLLGACRKHRKMVLGKRAFRQAVQLQPRQSAAYVLMCNMYADAGLWECVEEVEAVEKKIGAWTKPPGQSWVEHGQEVQSFVAGDHEHPQQDQLGEMLRKFRQPAAL